MMVSEIFFQSSIVNALIFLWIASAVSTTRILLRCEVKVSIAVLIAAFLGPAAFVLSWLYEAHYLEKKKPSLIKKTQQKFPSSLAAIFLVSLGIVLSFYLLFVTNAAESNRGSEENLRLIGLFIIGVGFLGGNILAGLTRRVAFLESCWVVFFASFFTCLLKEWVNEVFAYGTSAVYFLTLIISSTVLLLVFLTLGGAIGYLLFGEGRFNPKFSYESFIGFRFLMTKRSSQVVSLITVISVMAVTFACGGMIIVMSVMNGFTADIRAKILGANAHLMVLKYGNNDFQEYKEVIEKTKNIEGVIGLSAFVLNEGMVSSNKNLSGALITGIDIASETKLSELLKYISKEGLNNLADPTKIAVALEEHNSGLFGEKLVPNKEVNNLPGVIIGKEMSADLQVFVGDTINLVNPLGDLGPTGPIPKSKAFRVAGLFYSGMYEYDAKFAYIRLDHAQEFFNLKGSVSGVEYRVADIEKTKAIAKKIDSLIGGYPFYTRDWIQMNRNMFSALQLEKIAMLIILGTLILMASLLILVTLIMVVMEKGKEIAILKSMGATDVSIMKIFVSYGLMVGSLGAFFGGTFGIFVCKLIDRIGIRLDPDIYYIANLPIKIVNAEVSLVILSAVLISFLATIPPSLFAARLRPVEGLRYE